MTAQFTQRQAARECGVSRSTIYRRRENGEFPNATKTDDGWIIPLQDLLAAGLKPGKPTDPDPTPTPAPDIIDLREQLHTAQLATKDAELAAAQTRIQEVKTASEAQIEAMRGQVLAIEATSTEKSRAMAEYRNRAAAEATAKEIAQAAEQQANRYANWWMSATIAALMLAAFTVLLALTNRI